MQKRIEFAKRVKTEFERFPEMVKLRQQLIAAGMCSDSFASIAVVITDKISFHRHPEAEMFTLSAESFIRMGELQNVQVPRSTKFRARAR